MKTLEYKVRSVVKFFDGRIKLSESTIQLEGDLKEAERHAMQATIHGLKEDAEDEGLDHWSEGIQEIKVSARL